jgi:hypothetical protein
VCAKTCARTREHAAADEHVNGRDDHEHAATDEHVNGRDEHEHAAADEHTTADEHVNGRDEHKHAAHNDDVRVRTRREGKRGEGRHRFDYRCRGVAGGGGVWGFGGLRVLVDTVILAICLLNKKTTNA